MTFADVTAKLRRKNRKQYLLLAGCCFFSVLLITAFACMMRSPTVLSVLPEGGDSRKQVMMIFVLTVIGCAVFTTYAAGLFFREKSREMGVFLALGTPRFLLRRVLARELSLTAVLACGAGAVLGGPLAWGIWQLFRLILVDTEEMRLSFDPRCYVLSAAFILFVLGMLLILGARAVRRTDILSVIRESHTAEPIRAVPRWYGPAGILLVIGGGLLGYLTPSFFIRGLHWYPPEGLTAIFYLPALVGLYWILLHTVVNGWGRKRHRYKDLISTSMMRFQGRQTVRNMLVMTLLIAGAYFASFYTPMLGTGAMLGFDQRTVDYAYHWRCDQRIPDEAAVRSMAKDQGVHITFWGEAPMIRLAVDDWEPVETRGAVGTTWHEEYREQLQSERFLSESGYAALTGQTLEVAPGTAVPVFDSEGSSGGIFGGNASLLTNPVTGQQLSVTPTGEVRDDLLFGRYILDDADFALLAEGLTPEWREEQVFFNVENRADTYDFAKTLFNAIVDASGPEVSVGSYWDPVTRAREIAATGSYWGDEEKLSYDQRNSSEFRLYWAYMPQFQVLDKADFVQTVAVFLMLFIFIAIVCFGAVCIIAYTRCMTIALTNRRVYEDLRRLGASEGYLFRSVRHQIRRVFLVPILTGTTVIYAFYAMIMYFNGDPAAITQSEAAGLLSCLAVIAAVSLLLWAVYRVTLKSVCRAIGINRQNRGMTAA